MRHQRIDRVLLGISISSFVLMSVSFLLIPIEGMNFIPGVLFWLGLLVGSTLQVVLETRRRTFFKTFTMKRENMQKPRNGLLSIASNTEAQIVDVMLLVSFIATILAFVFTKGYGYICYVLIATTTLSFCLHCIFNGRIYFHTKNQMKVREVLTQKKANSTEKGEKER